MAQRGEVEATLLALATAATLPTNMHMPLTCFLFYKFAAETVSCSLWGVSALGFVPPQTAQRGVFAAHSSDGNV